MRIFSGLPLSTSGLRRFRYERATAIALAAVVTAVTFGVVGLPRWVNQASDAAVSAAINEATPQARNLQFDTSRRIGAGNDDSPFLLVEREATDLKDDLPSALSDLVFSSTYGVLSPTFEVRDFPTDSLPAPNRYFTFQFIQGIEDRVDLVEGSWPEPRTDVEFEQVNSEIVELAVFETALTRETASWMRVDVGDRVRLSEFADSPRNNGLPLGQLDYEAVLEIAGIVEPIDPNEEFWYGDSTLFVPGLIPTLDATLVFGLGVMNPQDYDELLRLTLPSPWYYRWHQFLDNSQIDAISLATIDGALQELELQYGRATRREDLRLTSGMDQISETYLRQRSLTFTLLSLALAALIGISLAVSLLLGALLAQRKLRATTLTRGRGASTSQLLVGQVLEFTVLLTPAAGIGFLLARLVVGRPGNHESMWFLGTLLFFVLVATIPSLPILRTDLGTLISGRRRTTTSTLRRVLLEMVIVIIAVVGVLLLRRRGLGTGSEAEIDPLLSSVPMFVGLAAGIMVVRVFPAIARILGKFLSRGKGITAFIGIRRIDSLPTVAHLPTVVLTLAVSTAVLGVILLSTTTEAQKDAAFQAVGADYRLQPTQRDAGLSTLIDLSEIEGVEATAKISQYEARLTGRDFVLGPIAMFAVDPDIEVVLAGTRGDLNLPGVAMDVPVEKGLGTEGNPIPVVVSSVWPGEPAPAVGDVFDLRMAHSAAGWFQVIELRDAMPGYELSDPFVIAARSALGQLERKPPLSPNLMLVKGPDTIAAVLKNTVADQSIGTGVISREDELSRYRDAPLIKTAGLGWTSSAWFGAILAALGALAGVALTSPDRRRDLGYLRTLGISSGQTMGMAALEQIPPVILGAVGGVGTGIGLSWLLVPGLDLASISGATGSVPLVMPWTEIAALAIVIPAALLLSVLVFSFLTRRMNLGNLLRTGERQ